MIDQFSSWLIYQFLGFPRGNQVGAAAHFFVYDSIKILMLLAVMIILMGYINSYFPFDKIRSFLTKRKWYGFDHFLAAIFGAITPFCSCSSIPLFIGFLRGGIPLGVTFSFLITSPLVNEVAIAMFIGLFGLKITLIYVTSGVVLGVVVGIILSKFNLEKYLESWVIDALKSRETINDNDRPISFNERSIIVLIETKRIVIGILPYLFIGIGIGALIHGFIPTGYFEKWITKENPLAVPIAVILGVPMYANATSVVPILNALVDKGIPIGTALAFSMAVVGLSLPEATLLRKVMKPRLIAIFFGSVTISIIILGYFYNLVL